MLMLHIVYLLICAFAIFISGYHIGSLRSKYFRPGQFEVPEEKLAELNKWRNDIHDRNCEITGRANPYGAAGGASTYKFTPTNLGVVCTVTVAVFKKDDEGKVHLSEETLDLTDYDMW